MKEPGDQLHAANKLRWDAAATNWARSADSRGLWRRCPTEPELVLGAQELRHLADVAGKRVCVLGSGDNQVVFALAGLGAAVTSVDISQNQLHVAERRAAELGIAIDFVQADVTDLSVLSDGSFDVVYTGGHVAVWVTDLNRYYAEAARIVRAGGSLHRQRIPSVPPHLGRIGRVAIGAIALPRSWSLRASVHGRRVVASSGIADVLRTPLDDRRLSQRGHRRGLPNRLRR